MHPEHDEKLLLIRQGDDGGTPGGGERIRRHADADRGDGLPHLPRSLPLRRDRAKCDACIGQGPGVVLGEEAERERIPPERRTTGESLQPHGAFTLVGGEQPDSDSGHHPVSCGAFFPVTSRDGDNACNCCMSLREGVCLHETSATLAQRLGGHGQPRQAVGEPRGQQGWSAT